MSERLYDGDTFVHKGFTFKFKCGGMWRDPAFKDAVGSAENLHAWLKSKSWTMRRRTW